MKKKKLFFCGFERELRERFRRGMVFGLYGRNGRCIMIRKAGRLIGFKEEVPFRKK